MNISSLVFKYITLVFKYDFSGKIHYFFSSSSTVDKKGFSHVLHKWRWDIKIQIRVYNKKNMHRCLYCIKEKNKYMIASYLQSIDTHVSCMSSCVIETSNYHIKQFISSKQLSFSALIRHLRIGYHIFLSS